MDIGAWIWIGICTLTFNIWYQHVSHVFSVNMHVFLVYMYSFFKGLHACLGYLHEFLVGHVYDLMKNSSFFAIGNNGNSGVHVFSWRVCMFGVLVCNLRVVHVYVWTTCM